ncbi:BMP family lipoprotein [Halorussus halophilus]|uniref:BMP family lipoprotein n=1 Tax=Halorussus halophilus TaxID=2650975 RepID=UPI001300E9C8|nr:BMP family protein [Halorussus halophilus]
MSNSDRRTFLKLTGGAVGVGALSGCISLNGSGGSDTTTEETTSGSSGTTDASGTTDDSTTSGGEANADLNVGMVYALGGLGDKSFNDMANKGVKRAEEEMGITFQNAQPQQQSDFKTLQRRFASQNKFDLICCIGYAQTEALKANSKNFSDQDFMLVDSVVEQSNVANYTFKEHQGSFLVGQLASMLTTRDFSAGAGATASSETKVGFVGGVKVPLIEKFQAGFEKGVAHANSDVSVDVTYTGSFGDPSKGKEAALSMYQNGADIVYHAAGATGLGVFKAAQQEGRFAVGVDADQSRSEPSYKDVILASMVKRVDNAVYKSIDNKVNGNYNGGGVQALGLEKDGVACVYGQSLGSDIPQEVKDGISQSRQKIIDGDISVPTKPQ